MATVLLAWELGGGMGHLAPHSELIASLLQRGHSIHIAARDVGRAGVAFEGLPLHYWPVPLSLDLPAKLYNPTISLAHILHNTGFANASDLAMRITAWRNLCAVIRPDVLIADYSPTALLAVRGSQIRTIVVGMGFCIPPNQSPLPAFSVLSHLARMDELASDEAEVIGNINVALTKHGLPTIKCLADVFHDAGVRTLSTIEELDHYPNRGSADYFGFPPERHGKSVSWPNGNGRRIFAYLKPFASAETLFHVLNQLKLPTVIACDRVPDAIRKKAESATLSFVASNVDLTKIAHECHIAITNGNHTTTGRILLAGKPVLMIPLQLEQELIAHAVTARSLGVTVKPNDEKGIFPKLAELLNTNKYHTAASAFAAKFSATNSNFLARMLEAIEAAAPD